MLLRDVPLRWPLTRPDGTDESGGGADTACERCDEAAGLVDPEDGVADADAAREAPNPAPPAMVGSLSPRPAPASIESRSDIEILCRFLPAEHEPHAATVRTFLLPCRL